METGGYVSVESGTPEGRSGLRVAAVIQGRRH